MLQPDILQRFTSHLKEALQKALAFAIQSGRDLVEPGDLLVGLLQEKGSIGAEILLKSHITAEAAERAFGGLAQTHVQGAPVAPDLSPAVKRLLEKCVLTAHVFEQKYIGTEHLLMALLETPLPDIHQFLETNGVQLDAVKEQAVQVLKSTSHFPDLHPPMPSEVTEGAESAETKTAGARAPRGKAMDIFTRDLTSPESIAQLDPVIGRDAETDRVLEVLCRRFKNNPILLGEPGVGKTAIVEGLAQRLASDQVPETLRGKRLLALDLALMVAGTMYRGEFEARLKQLVDEVRQDKDVILFIDEMHTLVGAGSTSGSLDAANMLKPALARGEIRCIGATTWAEYKKHIEPDAALERRYQPVDVQEPNAEMTLRMLQGLKQRYETHHEVRYEPAALEAAVRLSERYITDRFFPDKAIDALDEAAAAVNAHRPKDETRERLHALEIALHVMQEKKEEAVKEGDLPIAKTAKQDEDRLLKEKKNLEQTIRNKRERLVVTAEDVARIIARHARIPASLITANEHEQLRDLEANLNQNILGQTQAVRVAAEAIRKARLGLGDPRRPKASLLFVGPSGVGKTELARRMSHELFGREDTLLKFDMSEFSEGHSIAKLLGSPAGYVGYRETNRLTDALRKRPHSVILFDEFEKAHADVQHLLLQILEDGQIADASGRNVSFRQSYVILTSNVGAEVWMRSRLGFNDTAISAVDASTHLLKEHLKDRFRPELLNRLDSIVPFQPLEREHLRKIVQRELEDVFKRVQETRQIATEANDEVIDWLLSQNFKPEEGARAARHLVEREVTPRISQAFIDKPTKRRWQLKVKKNVLTMA